MCELCFSNAQSSFVFHDLYVRAGPGERVEEVANSRIDDRLILLALAPANRDVYIEHKTHRAEFRID